MKFFLKSLIIIGFSLAYITTSSLDANTLSFNTSLLFSLLSICLMGIGVMGLNILKERQRRRILLAKKSRAKALEARNIASLQNSKTPERTFRLILEV